MSEIVLKQINTKEDEYRSVTKEIINHFINTGEVLDCRDKIEAISEPILMDGKEICIDFDSSYLDEIVFSEREEFSNKYQREAYLAVYLSKIMKSYPINIIYERTIWTYINLTVLLQYVTKLYLSGNNIKNPEDRIRRCLFNEVNHSKIDRSGMRFLWYLGTKLSLYDSVERALAAMEFIDPVKAIFERKMACNSEITKAFVDAIVKGGKNRLLKSNEMRKAVPYHIQCYAGVVNLDAYDYDELVDLFVHEQNRILAKVDK